MLQHTITRSITDTSNKITSDVENIQADSERNYDGQITNGSTNQLVAWDMTRSLLQSIAFWSDQPITICTNNPSGSSPQDTITLVGTQVKPWTLETDLIGACPFAGNVTALYITNTSGFVANIKIRALAHCGQ